MRLLLEFDSRTSDELRRIGRASRLSPAYVAQILLIDAVAGVSAIHENSDGSFYTVRDDQREGPPVPWTLMCAAVGVFCVSIVLGVLTGSMFGH